MVKLSCAMLLLMGRRLRIFKLMQLVSIRSNSCQPCQHGTFAKEVGILSMTNPFDRVICFLRRPARALDKLIELVDVVANVDATQRICLREWKCEREFASVRQNPRASVYRPFANEAGHD